MSDLYWQWWPRLCVALVIYNISLGTYHLITGDWWLAALQLTCGLVLAAVTVALYRVKARRQAQREFEAFLIGYIERLTKRQWN